MKGPFCGPFVYRRGERFTGLAGQRLTPRGLDRYSYALRYQLLQDPSAAPRPLLPRLRETWQWLYPGHTRTPMQRLVWGRRAYKATLDKPIRPWVPSVLLVHIGSSGDGDGDTAFTGTSGSSKGSFLHVRQRDARLPRAPRAQIADPRPRRFAPRRFASPTVTERGRARRASLYQRGAMPLSGAGSSPSYGCSSMIRHPANAVSTSWRLACRAFCVVR